MGKYNDTEERSPNASQDDKHLDGALRDAKTDNNKKTTNPNTNTRTIKIPLLCTFKDGQNN